MNTDILLKKIFFTNFCILVLFFHCKKMIESFVIGFDITDKNLLTNEDYYVFCYFFLMFLTINKHKKYFDDKTLKKNLI